MQSAAFDRNRAASHFYGYTQTAEAFERRVAVGGGGEVADFRSPLGNRREHRIAM